jgi:hypothetical protein
LFESGVEVCFGFDESDVQYAWKVERKDLPGGVVWVFTTLFCVFGH